MANITMPDNSIICKFEETDMGDNYTDDIYQNYISFMRDEIIDQTPDILPTSYGEDGNPNQRSEISRRVLNNRHNAGTRHGEEFFDTLHEDIFTSDMEVDSRGTDLNPNFTHLNKHTTSRFKDHEVIMGHNIGASDYIEVEGPKNAVREQKDQMEQRMRNKQNMKWFNSSKEGQNRRSTKPDIYDNTARVATRDGTTEGFMNRNNKANFDPNKMSNKIDTGLWRDTLTAKFNRTIHTDVSHGKLPLTLDTGMWRNTKISGLVVQKYTDYTGGGRHKFSDKSKVGESDTTQAFTSQRIATNLNNLKIANTMKTIIHIQETQAKSQSKLGMNPGIQRHYDDINKINYNTEHTQSSGRSKNGMMIGSNLNYKSDVQAAIFSAKQNQRITANARMAEASKISAVLGGKTKSNNRKTQNMTIWDQLRGRDQKSRQVAKFRVESRDMIKDKFNSNYQISVPSISHLTVQTYTSSGKHNTMGLVHEGKAGGIISVHDSNITRDRGRNKKDTFIGSNKHDSEIGDKESKVFGRGSAEGRSSSRGVSKSGFTANSLLDKGLEGDLGDSII